MKKSNEFNEVVAAILAAETSGNAGQKAAATRRLNSYVDGRVKSGKDRKWVLAGVKARLTKNRKLQGAKGKK